MARSHNGGSWVRSNSSVFGSSGILSVAFGSGLFVAVGHDGIMAWSRDGMDWEPLPLTGFGRQEQITGVAADGRGRFVAVGSAYADGAGRIVSWYQKPVVNWPPPGAGFIPVDNWGTVNLGDSAIRGIAWNGGRYVAVGEGFVAVSLDGRAWSRIPGEWNGAANNPIHFRDITWGDGRFVAVGYRANTGNNVGVIAVSHDGMVWTLHDAPILRQFLDNVGVTLVVDPRVYGVAFADGYYVAVGERGWSAWSRNAVDWNPVWIAPFSVFLQNEINQTATSIATDGTVFLVGGTMGRLASSSNCGRSWDWIANGLLDGEFNDILALAYGNGVFVAAGANGGMRIAERGHIGTDANWIGVQSRLHDNINAVAWGGGHFVAAGKSGGMAFSVDGSRWTMINPAGVGSGDDIYSVTAGNRFVAGGRGKIIYSD